MFAQRITALVHVDASLQRYVPLLEFPHNGFQLLQRFFKGKAGNIVGSIGHRSDPVCLDGIWS